MWTSIMWRAHSWAVTASSTLPPCPPALPLVGLSHIHPHTSRSLFPLWFFSFHFLVLGCGGGEREDERSKPHSFLFSPLGIPPKKSSNSKCGRYTHPPNHEHHTSVLPTLHPTLWCWFYCDWMSLIGMISFHGYQNLSSPPTSKPSCDRYTRPPKRKPTPPCSPDDVLPAHMNIMAS